MAVRNEPCTSANNADSVPSICAISEGCSVSLGKQCFKQECPGMGWNIKHVYLSFPKTVTLARPSQHHAGQPYTKVYVYVNIPQDLYLQDDQSLITKMLANATQKYVAST